MDSLITPAAHALAAGDPLGALNLVALGDDAPARYLEVRRLLLIGRLDEAERTFAELDPAPFPPATQVSLH